ncbi:uncharacterized protein LOC118751549 [Rhagoletis pomonella]|uniref:uncharacterized protein LOC118751549 n=1 Tax=Rhagoletis pomonella TaxID=28610 RepID=UPI0017825230|nr:uncharacterized protein LOC118751549 [Rhagoletis pomonella]
MAIVELFTKNGRPLHMADDRAFKILTLPIFSKLKINLNEHNVIKRIEVFSNDIKSTVTEELKGRLLSLKIYAATRQHLSVIGINVQYIKNETIISQTLANKELRQRHTGHYLKSVKLEVLNDYKIDINQILTITTDNGANMVKAVHDLNADLRNDQKDDLTENSLILIENSFRSQIIASIRCGSHTLQLCVNDVLNKEETRHTIEKCRCVIKKLRCQIYLNILKSGAYKISVLDCVTRWNSTYNMIENLYELKEFVTSLSLENTDLLISHEEWNFIPEFLKIFKSFYTVIVKLQSEKLLYSDLYIIIMDIILQVENLPRSELRVSLLSSLNKRKSKLFENDLFNAAVYLHPRITVILNSICTIDEFQLHQNHVSDIENYIVN